MKIKTAHLIIIILLVASILVTVFMYPATAVYNEKTGTLKLSARFRSVFFSLKNYIGKKGEEVQGKIKFTYDYTKKGTIKYAIFSGGTLLLQGSESYEFNNIAEGTLPDEIVVVSTTVGEPASRTFNLN